jgi:hypothetical protein
MSESIRLPITILDCAARHVRAVMLLGRLGVYGE